MNQGPDTVEVQDAIRDAVEGILVSMPPPVAEAIRLAAIPHWFDENLLELTVGDRVDVGRVLAYVRDFRFVRQDVQEGYRFHNTVRDYLLTWWRRERPDEYKAANQVALDYFNRLAGAAIGIERPAYEREVLYHQLIVDESTGLHYLSTRFEDARGNYQLSLAEGLVAQAAQLKDILTDVGRMWVQYFEARLDLAYRQSEFGEAIFQDLADHAPDPVLQAVAGWSLGEIRVRQQHWSQAIGVYRASLDSLQRQRALMYGAQVMLALGDAYRDLAESSGGLRAERDKPFSTVIQFLLTLQYLPFLVYEWLIHRVNLLPNWYFGTNYQDWIIAYLLVEATRWYRRAERQLKDIGDTQGQVEAQMYLAEIEHQLGKWSRARRWFTMLLKTENIRVSLYRTARVQLGQGRAFLREGDSVQAETVLSKALETFRRFRDQGSIGATCLLLGRSYAALGRLDEAVSVYTESVHAFGAVGDQLARTQVIWDLKDLAQRKTLSDKQRQQIDAVVAQVAEQHYITRFSDALLGRFRKLALLGALPVTYVASFVAGLGLTLLLWAIESLFLLQLSGEQFTLDKALIIIATADLAFLLPLWLYRLIYSLMGVAVVRGLGRRLNPIEREQPNRFVSDTRGLTCNNVSQGLSRTVLWSDVYALASVDYYQRWRPIHLISRTILAVSSGTAMVVDGITTGYEHLKQDIARHVALQRDGARQHNLDFVIFNGRWMLVVLAISLAVAVPLRPPICSFVQGSSREVNLILAPIMLSFVLTSQLVFPTVVLWRLVAQRSAIRSTVEYKVKTIPTWVLWLAALVATAVAALWIVFIALWTLSVPQQCNGA